MMPSVIQSIVFSDCVRFLIGNFCSFTANDALKKIFAKCRDGKIRVLKISIENGEFFLFVVNLYLITIFLNHSLHCFK